MSPPIKNVAVAGATGNIGPTLVKTLAASGFYVTALSRSIASTKAQLGEDCRTLEVDYRDHDSLQSALHGQDAVVVCGVSMLPEQTNLIDAAIAAGVSRFIPADFAGDLNDPRIRAMQINKNKAYVEDYLKTHESQISHTSIRTGPLFDFCVARGVLVNIKERSQTRFDDGEKRFSTTTIPTAAKAVETVLKLGDKSANRAYLVQDFVATQNQLLRLAKEVNPGEEWTVTSADTAEMAIKAEEILKQDPNSRIGIVMQRGAWVFGKSASSEFPPKDNHELGIVMMNESQMKNVLKTLMPTR